MLVMETPSARDTLMINAEFPAVAPDVLFEYWVRPELLHAWWPQEAEVDGRLGGIYHLAWPALGWHLRGRYTTFEPGRRLGFTWKWDSEPDEAMTKDVLVAFAPLAQGNGTRLTIVQGPYTEEPEDQQLRAGHVEGWQHFLPRLAEAARAAASQKDSEPA
jgi:uncharacterized protein YndB with AHSA1/START domain